MRTLSQIPKIPNKESSFLTGKTNSEKQTDRKTTVGLGHGFDMSQISILPSATSSIQPKLKIGQPNDKYEQEADRVADQIVGRSNSTIQQKPLVESMNTLSPIAQRKCSNCDEEEEIQTKALGETPQSASQSLTSRIQNSRGGGVAMDNATQSFMSSSFGTDFSNVKIHTGSAAAQMNQEINAKAFTVGNDVYFNKGEYNPNSGAGKHLLAHELTHTIQQKGRSQIQRQDDSCKDKPIKTVTVDLLSFNGSNRNPNDDLAEANRIYAQCCVKFVLGQGMSIDTATSDSLMGGDTTLDRLRSSTRASAEELALRNEFPLSGRLRAFYVEQINPGARGTSNPPYYAKGGRAPMLNYVYITNSGASRTLAHEFGHVLLDGYFHELPSDNLMHPSNTATGSNLTAEQCETIRNNI